MSGGVIIPPQGEVLKGAGAGMALFAGFALLIAVSLNQFAGLPIFWTPADAHHAAAEGEGGGH
jgi:hypothetical protein